MSKILLHTAIITLILSGIFFGTLRMLDSYTNHGRFVEVPDFRGQSTAGLNEYVADKGVSFEIVDSIYDPKQKPGRVLRQDPDPGSKVKHNRTVYLNVTCMVPPQIEMPGLIDRSERQARYLIETYGLKMGSVTYEKADCNGCVIAQTIKGVDVQPGEPVKKGTVVSLVIGMKDPFYVHDSLMTK